METDFVTDGDGWLNGFTASVSHQLFSYSALLTVLLVIVAVGCLAMIVASMSYEAPEESSTSTKPAREPVRWADLFANACAWTCPWQPHRAPISHRRHVRVRRGLHSALGH